MKVKDIPGYPNYVVASNGDICKKVDGGHKLNKLNPFKMRDLPYVSLYQGGRRNKKTFGAHVLVAKAFVERPGPEYTQVKFKDGNKANYAADNLEWVKPSKDYKPCVKDNRDKIWPQNNWKFAIGDCISQHAKYGHPLQLNFASCLKRVRENIEEACEYAGIAVTFDNESTDD